MILSMKFSVKASHQGEGGEELQSGYFIKPKLYFDTKRLYAVPCPTILYLGSKLQLLLEITFD